MARPKMTPEQKAEAAAKRQAAQTLSVESTAESTTPIEAAEPDGQEPEAIKQTVPQVAAKPQEIPKLADFIAANERDGIVLVRVTYPGAEPSVFNGKYSGIVVADGPLSCTYADGSTT